MDWDDCYREAETPWDLGGPAPPLLEFLATHPPEIWGDGPVLVPGCGRGHDAAALAAAGHSAIGLDIAPAALREATALHGESARLGWMEADFFDPAAGRDCVSAIFEHTCFCAIPPAQRPAYVEAAARWLRPGGRLVGLFFLNPPGWEEGGEGPPFGATREEIRGLFEGRFELQRDTVPQRAHPGREGREWLVDMVRRD